jgi:hypothetical protein
MGDFNFYSIACVNQSHTTRIGRHGPCHHIQKWYFVIILVLRFHPSPNILTIGKNNYQYNQQLTISH